MCMWCGNLQNENQTNSRSLLPLQRMSASSPLYRISAMQLMSAITVEAKTLTTTWVLNGVYSSIKRGVLRACQKGEFLTVVKCLVA